MNPLRTICLVACLLAATFASPNQKPSPMGGSSRNAISNSLKPTDWLSISELESLPAMDQITLQKLEQMSKDEGATLIDKIYHLSQLKEDLSPSFVPNPNDIPVFVMKPKGKDQIGNLNDLVAAAKQQTNFGNEEVTIFITGLPEQQSETVKKANQKLVQAYMQRYNLQRRSEQNKDYDYGSQGRRTSSEEDYQSESWKPSNTNTGNLIIIDLGSTLTNFQRLAMLNVEKTGSMIAKVLVQLTNEVDMPQEIIHLVGQGIGAHVAGAAGRQFTRLTGHKLRRITGLDPSKIFAKNPNTLTGLARGDAEFVDAIHTSSYGMGTPARSGNADFYPNGPSVGVPGSDNVVEAAMRATRYFAESVRPGNERNFPAVAANSLQQYKSNNGYGKRVYMGIDTEFDVEGDFILQVNSKSPFGKAAPAQKQNTYHGMHQPWNSQAAQKNE